MSVSHFFEEKFNLGWQNKLVILDCLVDTPGDPRPTHSLTALAIISGFQS